MKRATVIAAVLAAAVSAAGAAGAGQVAFCKGAQLSGTFAVIPGSPGAGNIVYRLKLRNRSTTACAVSGLPAVQLLAKSGKRLPTHVIAARPGTGTAALILLAPGRTATATARFSPDIPGPGEPVTGHTCEATASSLRVTARGGGTTVVPISPPTPVCEHGQLQFSLYSRV